MADRATLHDFIVQMLNEGFERDQAEEVLVWEEIKRRGTRWAAHEIWSLRRRVASLEKRVAEYEAKERGES